MINYNKFGGTQKKMIKKIIAILLLIFAVPVYATSTLYEYYNGNLPSIEDRAVIYNQYLGDEYTGTKEQNIYLLEYLLSDNSKNIINSSDDYTSLNLGGLQVAADFSTSLSSGISSDATTLTVVSTTTSAGENLIQGKVYGLKLGGREYVTGTLSSGKQFTSLTRGISTITGTTTTSSAEAWGRGTSVELTDAPIVIEVANKLNGSQRIDNLLRYDDTILINTNTASTTLATKYYVDNTAAAGCANANTTTKGCVEIATSLEAASSTPLGGTGAVTVLPSSIATSSPFTPGNYVPITNARGVLSPAFIATTTQDVPNGYTFGTTILSTASTTLSGPSTLASSTIQNALITNIVSIPVLDKILATSTDINVNTNSATSTILTFNVQGGSLGTNSGIAGKFRISNLKLSQNNAVTFEGLYGGTAVFDISTTTTGTGSGWTNGIGEFNFTVQGNGSTSIQEGDASMTTFIFQNTAAAGTSVLPMFFIKTSTGSSAVNSNIDQTFSLVIRFNSGDAESGITVTDAQAWYIK